MHAGKAGARAGAWKKEGMLQWGRQAWEGVGHGRQGEGSRQVGTQAGRWGWWYGGKVKKKRVGRDKCEKGLVGGMGAQAAAFGK